jgi:hypothetical protein
MEAMDEPVTPASGRGLMRVADGARPVRVSLTIPFYRMEAELR